MTARPRARQGAGLFDMQAAVGVTKHMGGLGATRELLGLCQVQAAHEVLHVGCGIGAGPACIARTFGCRVVGVDLSQRMIGWARRRVRQERVEDLVEFRTADVLALPFPDDRFDVVVCEPVLAFVEDKRRAIGECVRVTRPGGHVGLNEGLAHRSPTRDGRTSAGRPRPVRAQPSRPGGRCGRPPGSRTGWCGSGRLTRARRSGTGSSGSAGRGCCAPGHGRLASTSPIQP